MLNLTNDTFAETIFTTNKPFLVQFSAEWCSVCKDLYPVIEQLEQEYQNQVTFVKIDVDTDADLADQFKIDKLPTFLLFKDREIVDCIVGAESLNHFKTRINEVIE
jgi:thioredoxin 1